MSTIIRPASAADLPVVERIVRDAYTKYVERIGKLPGPMRDDYGRRIREQAVWVLVDGTDIAGLVVLLPEDGHLLLDNVAVDPSCQGKGIGGALIRFAEQEARRRGYNEIRLYTHQEMRENLAMYVRMGYAEIGRGRQAGFLRVFLRKGLG